MNGKALFHSQNSAKENGEDQRKSASLADTMPSRPPHHSSCTPGASEVPSRGGPKREAKHSLHTPVGVTFLQGPQFRMGAAGAPRRMCCQVRCPSLRTRPEQGRAQLRDQEITTHARLSSHAMHRSQPSQGSSDHLEASVGLRLRSLPLEPGQDRTKPSKAMFVKKCNDRKNIYTMPRRKGRVQNYGLCMHVFCGVFSSLHLLVYCGKD